MAIGYNRNPNRKPVLPQQYQAGGGINGGGETPSTKTLWSLKLGDLFIFGQFQDGKVFIEGPSENKMYVANPQGIILEFNDYKPEYEQQWVDLFKEYFADIESVQVLATGHEIDYVVPNWAEYKHLN